MFSEHLIQSDHEPFEVDALLIPMPQDPMVMAILLNMEDIMLTDDHRLMEIIVKGLIRCHMLNRGPSIIKMEFRFTQVLRPRLITVLMCNILHQGPDAQKMST